MPKIAKIQIVNDEVWCRVELERSTDAIGSISLYTPDEIKHERENAIKDFLRALFEQHVGDW